MNIETASEKALEVRRRLQGDARKIGVSEEFISQLVDEFYKKVRAHPELGPVFNDVIEEERWPEHLDLMKSFWTSVALRTGGYGRNPMQIHQALTNAKPEHFPIWLQLFEDTLREIGNDELLGFFMGYANTMAERLSHAMFHQ